MNLGRLISALAAFVLISACAAWAQQHPAVLIGGAGDPEVSCLWPFEDSRGRLWLAGCETGYEGMYLFDGSRFLSPEGFQKGPGVNGMAEDTEGGIWQSTSLGVFRIYGGKLSKILDGTALAGITRVAPDVFLLTVQPRERQSGAASIIRISRSANGWQSDSIQDNPAQVHFTLDASNNLLYGCAGGFCELSADDVVRWKPGRKLPVRQHDLGQGNLYAGGSSIVLRDRQNCVWFRNNTQASYQCPGQPKPIQIDARYVSTGFPQIYELKDGSILIPSYIKFVIGRPQKMEATDSQACGIVVPLRDGGLVTNSAKGLLYLPRGLHLEYWGKPEGLSFPRAIVRNQQGIYADDDTRTAILDVNRKSWRRLREPAGTMVPAGGGAMLVGAANTIYRMSPGWNVLERTPVPNLSLLSHQRDNSTFAVGDTIYRVLVSQGRTKLEPAGVPEPHAEIADIANDAAGTIWVCTSQGLLRRTSSAWQLIPAGGANANPGCHALTIAPDGGVWYSALVKPSLFHLEQAAGALVAQPAPIDEQRGLDHFLAVDKRGWIWRGNTNGLYVADPRQAREGKWLRLGFDDGLPNLDTNTGSFFEDGDGSIWFGATDFITHITVPNDLVHPRFTPTVAISGFASSGQALRIDEADNKFKSGSEITAYFGSLQFDRRDALHLRYRLLPGNGAWMETSGFEQPLGKLGWGKHTLQLQAQMGDGPWSKLVQQTVTVMVPAAFTWPALGSYAIVGAGAGLAGARWRRRRKAKLSRELPELSRWRLAALSPEFQTLDGALLDGRFRVGAIFARGGFAIVADGHDESHADRRCAIKVFRHDAVDQEWIRHRFQHEVRALEGIRHPNIVRIYGSGTAPQGALYLAMEFIEGTTLRALIDNGPIPRAQVARYLRQIGSALDAIHRRGICHRDVKPENLMLRHHSRPGAELVLIDFSIAIVKDPDKTVHGLSRAAGTISYMAPEQAIGYADPATDIYSLAKVLIEMITGMRLAVLLPDASMDLPERLRELIPMLPIKLSAASIHLFSSALEFDPSRRPANAGEFANRIAADLESNQDVESN